MAKNFQTFSQIAAHCRDGTSINTNRARLEMLTADMPAAIKAALGTRNFVLYMDYELFPAAMQSGTELFGLGNINAGTGPFVSLQASGLASNEAQFAISDGTTTLTSSEYVSHWGRRVRGFWYFRPAAGLCWFTVNGYPPGPMTGDPVGGTIATVGAFGSAGVCNLTFFNKRTSGGLAAMGFLYAAGIWYVPEGIHSGSQILQVAKDFTANGESSLLPVQTTYVDGNYNMAWFAPDDTDLADGKIRNRVVHSDGSGANANWNKLQFKGVNVTDGSIATLFAAVEGYDVTCPYNQSPTTQQNRFAFLRGPTANTFFSENGGTYGSITECFIHPEQLPAAGAGSSIYGDTNNYLQIYNTAGIYSIKWFLNGVAQATSDAARPPAADEWLHIMLVNTGAATNNLYIATHGYLNAAVTYATSAAAASVFCLMCHNNSAATPNSSIFSGALAFWRRFLIDKTFFPSAASLARIAREQAEQMEPGNSPLSIHPVLQELMTKISNGVNVGQSLTFLPGNIRIIGDEEAYWDAQAQNTASPASTFLLTFVKANDGVQSIAQHIHPRLGKGRRVIHIGAASGTNPSNAVSKGVPVVGDGSAAGPYRTATAFSDAEPNLLMGTLLNKTSGGTLRCGAHDYPVSTVDVPGTINFKIVIDLPVEPVYGDGAKFDGLVLNAADMRLKGGEMVGTGIGLSLGASVARITAEKFVAHDSVGDNVDVNAAATNVLLRDYISKDGAAWGVDTGTATVESVNGIVHGNVTGSINSNAATILKNNNLNVAPIGPDATVDGDHNIIGHTPKFYDVDAANKNLLHIKQSNTVHSGEGGKNQGPFSYNENPKWIMHIGGMLYLVEGAGIVKEI